jgi:hypothetical protein
MIRLIIASVFVIVFVGGIVAFVDQQLGFYLIVLFPILMGALGGFVGKTFAQQANISLVWAALIGILIGILTYFAYRYGDYLLFLPKLAAEGVTASVSFIEYTELQAELGITLSRVASSSSGIELKGQQVWIYWGAELLLIVVGAVAGVRNRR